MVQELTREEAIQRQYQLYRQKQAQRQAEQTREQQEKQARIQAIQAKYASRTVTARKPHICSDCGSTIQKGEKATVQRVVSGYGWPEGYHIQTQYTCRVCQPIKEEA